jgi:hypothetical protein
MDSDCRR